MKKIIHLIIAGLLPFVAFAQNAREIKGIVFDSATQTVLTEVRITVSGTAQVERTDIKGRYAIIAEKGSRLQFSLPGYETQEATVRKGSVIDVYLRRGLSGNRQKPNVIFLLADDLGWSQTSAYGSRYYTTPNIDRLASEGIRFTNAYAAAPDCSPTRASIMTGKYPGRLHLTDYIPGLKSKGRPLIIPDWQKFLPLEEYTLGELFRDNGYRTALFGKWHLSADKHPPKSLPYNPDKQGFEDVLITYKPSAATNPEHDAHNSDSIGNRAVKFIRKWAGKPFFMFLSFNAVHDPVIEKADSIAMKNSNPLSRTPENNPVLATMLKRMDDNIGKVLDELDKQGLKSNTIILFFSDNGGLEADAAQTPLRRGKGWLYEGGIREPLIIRWPGVVIAESESKAPVSSIDFLPTFCDLLKTHVPAGVDGISLLAHLKYNESLPERNLYWHYPHYMDALDAVPCGAVRSGKWKLIEWYEKSLLPGNGNPYELYDLERDESETVNLSEKMPSLTEKLAKDLAVWRKKVHAQMPKPAGHTASNKTN